MRIYKETSEKRFKSEELHEAKKSLPVHRRRHIGSHFVENVDVYRL